MASSTVSLQSHPLCNISPPQQKWSAADHVRTDDDHRRPKSTSSEGSRLNILSKSRNAVASIDEIGNVVVNAVDQTLSVETLEKRPKASDVEAKNLLIKSRGQSNTRAQDKVSEAANETLFAKNGDGGESIRPESSQLMKNKRAFSTFSVALTREKIEADLLAMGGSKRTRRAKKRQRSVQIQLDDLFPGLRLKYITHNGYKVRDH